MFTWRDKNFIGKSDCDCNGVYVLSTKPILSSLKPFGKKSDRAMTPRIFWPYQAKPPSRASLWFPIATTMLMMMWSTPKWMEMNRMKTKWAKTTWSKPDLRWTERQQDHPEFG